MDPRFRPIYNAAYTPAVYDAFVAALTSEVGPIPFRLAETPLFLTAELRNALARNAVEIVDQLSRPVLLNELKSAIPARYNVPGMDALPNCVQVDFALCPGSDGKLVGRLIELQAFPSLYALMDVKALAWSKVFQGIKGLDRPWTGFLDMDQMASRERVRRMLLGNEDPVHTVLVDIEPEHQKTSPDFVATEKLYGVEAVCVTKLIKRGNKLFRMRQGKEVQVKRIYNRMVFDELEAKNVQVPFNWNDELDITWCSHPNWYWTWSKFVLPHLDHPSVPKTKYLSDVKDVPADLSQYVLKPLFSFAGGGVKVDVTREDVDNMPAEQRSGWVLQEKVTYAHALPMPDGTGVKAEVRVMLSRAPDDRTLTPLLCLVRLSRGKMIGVDHNKNLTWVGGGVGIFPLE